MSNQELVEQEVGHQRRAHAIVLVLAAAIVVIVASVVLTV
jgi:hypothetical protein